MKNYKEDPIAQRLINEWRLHKMIILAVDFDDTIKHWRTRSQEECNKTIKRVVEAQVVGAHVVIFTACKADRFDEIRAFCKENKIVISSINENPIELPYGNDKKIYYNHLLDDRAGLEYAEDLLEYCLWVVSCDKHPNNFYEG